MKERTIDLDRKTKIVTIAPIFGVCAPKIEVPTGGKIQCFKIQMCSLHSRPRKHSQMLFAQSLMAWATIKSPTRTIAVIDRALFHRSSNIIASRINISERMNESNQSILEVSRCEVRDGNLGDGGDGKTGGNLRASHPQSVRHPRAGHSQKNKSKEPSTAYISILHGSSLPK